MKKINSIPVKLSTASSYFAGLQMSYLARSSLLRVHSLFSVENSFVVPQHLADLWFRVVPSVTIAVIFPKRGP